jgi:hypothetical protein
MTLDRAEAALAAGLAEFERSEAESDGETRENLFPSVDERALAEFGAGAGGELKRMHRPWTSAALVANAFTSWRGSEGSLVLCGLRGFDGPLRFEAKCPTGLQGTPPHLDVILRRGGAIVGVESKLVEPYRRRKPAEVAAAYYKLAERGDARAKSRWFAAFDRVGDFSYLDAAQLIKHFLGLANCYPDAQKTLVYLFWEPTNAKEEPAFQAHRAEIEQFADLVAGDPMCKLRWCSYAEHWLELENGDGPPWLPEHLALLRARYAVPLPSPVQVIWRVDESYLHFVFDPRPEGWGLRGDPFLWDALRKEMRGVIAATPDEIVAALRHAFRRRVGVDPNARNTPAAVYCEQFAHGGMSSGHVDIPTWRDRLLPLLEERIAEIFPG